MTCHRPLVPLLAVAWALVSATACAHAPRPEPATELMQPAAPSGPVAEPAPIATPAPAPATPPAPAPAAVPPEPELPVTVAAVCEIMLGSTFPDESKGSLL